MPHRTILGLVVLSAVLLGVVAGVSTCDDETRAQRPATLPSGETGPIADSPGDRTPRRRLGDRPAGTEERHVVAVVINVLNGEAVAGIEVGLDSSAAPSFETGSSGEVTAAYRVASGTPVRIMDPHWVQVGESHVLDGDEPALIEAVPLMWVEGTIGWHEDVSPEARAETATLAVRAMSVERTGPGWIDAAADKRGSSHWLMRPTDSTGSPVRLAIKPHTVSARIGETFRILAPATPRTLVVAHGDGYELGFTEVDTSGIDAGDRVEVSLRVRPAASYRFRVIDEDGVPIERARVRLRRRVEGPIDQVNPHTYMWIARQTGVAMEGGSNNRDGRAVLALKVSGRTGSCGGTCPSQENPPWRSFEWRATRWPESPNRTSHA